MLHSHPVGFHPHTQSRHKVFPDKENPGSVAPKTIAGKSALQDGQRTMGKQKGLNTGKEKVILTMSLKQEKGKEKASSPPPKTPGPAPQTTRKTNPGTALRPKPLNTNVKKQFVQHSTTPLAPPPPLALKDIGLSLAPDNLKTPTPGKRKKIRFSTPLELSVGDGQGQVRETEGDKERAEFMERALKGEEDIEYMPPREPEEEAQTRDAKEILEEYLGEFEIPKFPKNFFKSKTAWLPRKREPEEEPRPVFQEEDMKELMDEVFKDRRSSITDILPFTLPPMIRRKPSTKRPQDPQSKNKPTSNVAPKSIAKGSTTRLRPTPASRPTISGPRPLISATKSYNTTTVQRPQTQLAKRPPSTASVRRPRSAMGPSKQSVDHGRIVAVPPTHQKKVSTDTRDSQETKVDNVNVSWDWGEYWGKVEPIMDEGVGFKI